MNADFAPILNHWIFQSVAMVLTALLLPKFRVTSIFGPLLAVVGIAFINATLWDAALFFKIPDNLHSHAILLLFANALIFVIVVKVMPGIEITGIIPAILAPIIFTLSSVAIEHYGRNVDWNHVYSVLQEKADGVKNTLQDQKKARLKPANQ